MYDNDENERTSNSFFEIIALLFVTMVIIFLFVKIVFL